MAKKYCNIQNKAIINIEEIATVIQCRMTMTPCKVTGVNEYYFMLDILLKNGGKSSVRFDTVKEQAIAFNNILHYCINLEE